MSVKQNVWTNYENKRIKVQFEHCTECAYYKTCYNEEGKGPNFLDPECVERPVRKGGSVRHE
jgi:hypothetical protein